MSNETYQQDLYSGPIPVFDSNHARRTYLSERGYERVTEGSTGKGGHMKFSNAELLERAEQLGSDFERPRNFATINLPMPCSIGVWEKNVKQMREDLKLVQEAEQRKEAGLNTATLITLDDKRKFLLDNDFIPLENRGGTSQVWTHPVLLDLLKRLPQGMHPQQPDQHGKHGEAFTVMLSVLDATMPQNAEAVAKNWEQIKERVKWCKDKAAQIDRILKLTEHMEEMKMDICVKKKESSWQRNLGALYKQDPLKALSCAAEFRQKAERAIKTQVVLSGAVRSAQRALKQMARDFAK